MRIKELQIYGYGKMHNVTIRDLGKLHMFFGENEAGKSTIMSFIHSILFGFPAKNQTENRYEPKDYSAYGGKIIIETKAEGEVAVQRVKGKAAGDVTLTFSDGRTGDETDLKRILQGIDKQTFRSIFSFNLQGISDIHNLNEKEVSTYLFSAGLVGNDGLLRAEKYLQDEMEKLFKPKGRNLTINKMMSSIKQTSEKVKAAEAEQGTYNDLLAAQKGLTEEKNQLEIRVAGLEKEITFSQNYMAIEPLLAEKEQLQGRLSESRELPPLAGEEEKLKQLKEASLPVDMSVNSLESQLEAVNSKIKQIKVDEEFRLKNDAILQAIDQTATIDNLESEKYTIEHSIKQKETEIRQYKDFGYIDKTNEEILQMDTSSVKKELISRLDRQYQKLTNDRSHLETQQEGARRQLQEAGQKIAFLEESLLSKDRRDSVERQANSEQNKRETELELNHINHTIDSLEQKIQKTGQQEKQEQKNRKLLLTSITGLTVVGILLCILFKQLALLPVCIIGLGAAGWMYIKMKPTSLLADLEKELQEWKEKKAVILRKQSGLKEGYGHAQEAAEILRKDDESRQQLRMVMSKKEEYENQFNATVDAFEAWDEEHMAYQQSVSDVLRDWDIPLKEASASQVMSIYETLVSLKKCIYDLKHLLEKLETVDDQLARIQKRVFKLAAEFGRANPDSLQDAVLYLKNMSRYNERNADLVMQHKESARQISAKLDEEKAKQIHIQKELDALLKEAGCEEEAELLEIIQAQKEKEQVMTRISVIERQLLPYKMYITKAMEQTDVINEYTIRKLEEDLQGSKEKLRMVIERLADTKHRITQLEDGGTFDELSFEFHNEKSALNEEAKEWAKLALAKYMLKKVMDEYRNTKFPAILKKAGEHVGEITEGSYSRLFWSEETGSLKLQRHDGIVFDAKEVSRGTQEAVYVALRLSLAEHSYPEEPMPIIIDDSFVNFDIRRLRKVSGILERIGKRHQIIYFTCHDYMVDTFRTDSFTELNDMAAVKN